MINAIIFDCFGVLTTDLWLQFKDKYFADNSDLAEQATDLNKQSDRGIISTDEFTSKVAALAGISSSHVNFLPGYSAANQVLFAYIKDELKPHYKVGILSNASGNYLDTLFTPEQVTLFDETVLSSDVGMVKPQRDVYELIARKLNVTPEECIFVDDREVYCAAARDVGMQAICYEGFTRFKIDLEQLLYHS